MVGILFLVVSAVFVYFDARSIGVRKGLVTGLGDMGPVGWAIATLGLWIIAVPSYLYYRGEFKKAIAGQGDSVRSEIPLASPVAGTLSGWAIGAFYAGLISIALIPAPIAVVCGIMALREIRSDPGKRGKGRAIFGIVSGLLFTGLFAIGFIFGSTHGHH